MKKHLYLMILIFFLIREKLLFITLVPVMSVTLKDLIKIASAAIPIYIRMEEQSFQSLREELQDIEKMEILERI